VLAFRKTVDLDIDRDGIVDYGGDVIQEARFALFLRLTSWNTTPLAPEQPHTYPERGRPA